MIDHCKLVAGTLLSHVPGWIGARAENMALWAGRRIRLKQAEGQFEAELARLDHGAICIDLGANLGEVTERLAQIAGHVHAFEPDPWTFAQLQKRVGHLANVTLHPAAAGPRDGTMIFHRDPQFAQDPTMRSQGTSAFRSDLWKAGGEQIEVEMIDFRRFLRELDRDVALVKIDIEGGEAALLEALLDTPEASRIGAIFAETHECHIRELREPVARLRRRAKSLSRPRLYLDWH